MLLNEFYNILKGRAPLSYSKAFIEAGHHDNSGLLVKSDNNAKNILFSLDLTNVAVAQAEKLGCDTIVTHHPAIYYPIDHISYDDETAPILAAVKKNINVISMHLNLDIAEGGIDDYLAEGLGAPKNKKIVKTIVDEAGYGRVFSIETEIAENYVQRMKQVFGSDKLLYYGNVRANIRKIMSFCGGGSSAAMESGILPDLVVTSDMPHHILKYFLERNVNVLIIPHYVAENYGFRKFCKSVNEELNEECKVFFMEDGRFI